MKLTGVAWKGEGDGDGEAGWRGRRDLPRGRLEYNLTTRSTRDWFDHERLVVYRRATAFLVRVDHVVSGFPNGRRYLADQLLRAASSIVLNIAEGAGEYSRRDKARFYRIALRSATESAGVLDIGRHLGFMDQVRWSDARAPLVEVVALLTSMVKRLEEEADRGVSPRR